MNKTRLVLIGLAIVAISVFGLLRATKADVSFLDKIAQVAGQILGNSLTDKVNSSGALDIQASGEDLTFGAGPGGLSGSRFLNVNGDETYSMVGSFINASTTIVSFASPFLAATSSASDLLVTGTYPNAFTVASSTVEMVSLVITGVSTSTATFACGASTGLTTATSYDILSSDSVATSTKARIENNISSSYGSQIGGGSVAKIQLGPTYPYFVCKATTAYNGAFTEATNTFDGKFTVRISKTQ